MPTKEGKVADAGIPKAQEMTGVFVPFGVPRQGSGKNSARVGWITDSNGCDIWQGGNVKGYGTVKVNRKTQLVHRVRYEREIGPIPEGMELDHFVCDNGGGGCCNPRHCRPVTRRENMLRGKTVAAEARAKTHCAQGHLLSGDNLVRWNLLRGKRVCKTCTKRHAAAYQLAHRKTIYAQRRAWAAAHPDLIRAYNKKWKEKRGK